MRTRSRTVIAAAFSAALLFFGTAAAASQCPLPRVVDPHIVASFDFAAGQTPEDLAVEPTGAVDISMAFANQVVRVAPDGSSTLVAQLPTAGKCAFEPTAASVGLARADDGTLYVVECSGNSNTGVWRITPGGGAPMQIAQLPQDGFPNDLALDESSGTLYVTDSLRGEVWQVPTDGTPASLWASGPELRRVNQVGANGIAVHGCAVWVSNTDTGAILRIPIRFDGSAGPIQTAVSGLTGGPDNIDVVGPDDTIVVTLFFGQQVVLVRPGGQPQAVLAASDGLSNPTAAEVFGDKLFVTSGAYFTQRNPNLLVATFLR